MGRFSLALGGVLLMVLSGCVPARSSATPAPTPWPAEGVIMAGVRSSEYGIKPFPAPQGWEQAMATVAGYFPGAHKAAIWIVGTVGEEGTAQLEFPGDGTTYPHVVFAREDRHEDYLRYFDEHDVQVFLQVEPGLADVPTLIDLVLDRYGGHPSVIGFGVDVEWYVDIENGGLPVTDAAARDWEARVQAHSPAYRLFLKHWDPLYMPSGYRGDLVFVDDSQEFDNLASMRAEFAVWARTFYPNPVFYQIGYAADRKWWHELDEPPQAVGAALAQRTRQACGIFWVDFTLRQVVEVE